MKAEKIYRPDYVSAVRLDALCHHEIICLRKLRFSLSSGRAYQKKCFINDVEMIAVFLLMDDSEYDKNGIHEFNFESLLTVKSAL